jgi:hypothetical protein
MTWPVALAISVGLCAVSGTAAASPSARLVYLRNAGAESCPDEMSVRGAVAARLGYDPFFPSAQETMFIEVSRDREGYRARVKLVAGDNKVRGTRELSQAGESCSGIIDALALSMSIAIDPDSLTRAPTAELEAAASPSPSPPPVMPAAETAAAPAAKTAPTAVGADEVPARPSPRERPAVELWLAPAVWLSSGPASAVGGELGARLRWSHVSVGLSGRGDPPSSRTIDGVDVSLAFLGASGEACGHWSVLSACAQSTLGVVTSSSNASVRHDDSTTRWLVGASVGVEVPVACLLVQPRRREHLVGFGDGRRHHEGGGHRRPSRQDRLVRWIAVLDDPAPGELRAVCRTVRWLAFPADVPYDGGGGAHAREWISADDRRLQQWPRVR